MYAQTETIASSSRVPAPRPTRAALKTRPRIQRAAIRSWEYIAPVRISILIVRLLVVVWLLFLAAALMSTGYTWGFVLVVAAAAMLAVSFWVFSIAQKGWPAAEA